MSAAIKNGYLVTGLSQLLSNYSTGEACTDDGDFLWFHRKVYLFKIVVSIQRNFDILKSMTCRMG
jgi:hypothetical protein